MIARSIIFKHVKIKQILFVHINFWKMSRGRGKTSQGRQWIEMCLVMCKRIHTRTISIHYFFHKRRHNSQTFQDLYSRSLCRHGTRRRNKNNLPLYASWNSWLLQDPSRASNFRILPFLDARIEMKSPI